MKESEEEIQKDEKNVEETQQNKQQEPHLDLKVVSYSPYGDEVCPVSDSLKMFLHKIIQSKLIEGIHLDRIVAAPKKLLEKLVVVETTDMFFNNGFFSVVIVGNQDYTGRLVCLESSEPKLMTADGKKVSIQPGSVIENLDAVFIKASRVGVSLVGMSCDRVSKVSSEESPIITQAGVVLLKSSSDGVKVIMKRNTISTGFLCFRHEIAKWMNILVTCSTKLDSDAVKGTIRLNQVTKGVKLCTDPELEMLNSLDPNLWKDYFKQA
jgi:hypothetical protein